VFAALARDSGAQQSVTLYTAGPDGLAKGIAKALYRARQYTVKQLGLKGQMTVGMLNGYAAVKNKMSIDEYYEKVRNKQIFDPTVSMQEKVGFKIIGLMKNYLNDPTCGNAGALIILDANQEI
jgi:hypothetical protein